MAQFRQIWSGLREAGTPSPYLLIDSAGLESGRAQIPEHIFSDLDCLFTGDLAVELADVGPYLGRLNSYEQEVLDSVEDLMLRHVASVVVPKGDGLADAGFSYVHRHFRKMNVVYGPEGEPLFFRYYDPRVLPSVLRVMEPEQVALFFGPVQRILLTGLNAELVELQALDGLLVVHPPL
jgi:hypothetical protein